MKVYQICPYCKESNCFNFEEKIYPNFSTCPKCKRDVCVENRTNTSKKQERSALIVDMYDVDLQPVWPYNSSLIEKAKKIMIKEERRKQDSSRIQPSGQNLKKDKNSHKNLKNKKNSKK